MGCFVCVCGIYLRFFFFQKNTIPAIRQVYLSTGTGGGECLVDRTNHHKNELYPQTSRHQILLTSNSLFLLENGGLRLYIVLDGCDRRRLRKDSPQYCGGVPNIFLLLPVVDGVVVVRR